MRTNTYSLLRGLEHARQKFIELSIHTCWSHAVIKAVVPSVALVFKSRSCCGRRYSTTFFFCSIKAICSKVYFDAFDLKNAIQEKKEKTKRTPHDAATDKSTHFKRSEQACVGTTVQKLLLLFVHVGHRLVPVAFHRFDRSQAAT